ncbi:o-succinylbenzoate synthase [Bacteroidia bacterium]|nr:o-succinylbenzoate synthase [Bacteroidia bacterium]MDB9882963.1 o-succinylbenzoate synthase [Bacteroidia bacterium]
MYSYKVTEHHLQFVKPAKTSRNIFKTRTICLIELTDISNGKKGIGEAAPLSLLSIDDIDNYVQVLESKVEEFCETGRIEDVDLEKYPSIKFGLETALLSLQADTKGRMYDTAFTRGESTIPVNGLVWMADADDMYEEALSKIAEGFKVIKFKVGALDFDEECKMLEKIRKDFSAFKITIRVDANGGFTAKESLEQLKELSRFEIHSIEQPIMAGQWDDMARLCRDSAMAIALDEELIGVNVHTSGAKLLDILKPQYLILKPNLIGGVSIADEWIRLANKQGAGWWATSALESNIGLNAIAQWVSKYDNAMHQGLGTGSLFSNNFDTSLKLKHGLMRYEV